ncbi:MAG: hypothetical protein RLZZ15_215 [Verrucomicrobiota bacterium]|jgi:hypothetical protein
MITSKIKELAATKAKMADLEKSIAAQLTKELAALPAQYGFASAEEFARAVLASGGKPGKRGVTMNPVGKKPRKARVEITDAMRAKVKELAEAGKTGAEIAAAVGISIPSVQNVKKALGIVAKK